jgi:hypothetical protein
VALSLCGEWPVARLPAVRNPGPKIGLTAEESVEILAVMQLPVLSFILFVDAGFALFNNLDRIVSHRDRQP